MGALKTGIRIMVLGIRMLLTTLGSRGKIFRDGRKGQDRILAWRL